MKKTRRLRFAVTHPRAALSALEQTTAQFLGTHTAYTRFVLVSRSRTGSNLLMSMLNSHPQIKARGEIFVRLGDADADARLAQFYRRRYPRRIKAVGCKIHYHHPVDGSPAELRSALHRVPGLCVLHLRRRNILRTIASRELAVLTNDWVGREATGQRARRIELSPSELESGFKQTREWEAEAEAEFSRHRCLEVFYEDLVESPHDEFRKILGLLGLPFRDPRTSLRKQNPNPLPELIANYFALKEHFAETKWAAFFED